LEKVETFKRCLILFKVKESENFNLINLNPKELIMIQKNIEHFKKILTDQLRGLLIHAGATVSGMTTPKENLPDPAENNTFGICDKCEEEIAFKRLEARPVTTQCIDCKTKEEAYENARGV
jgi:DnaK suppressor protein